MLGCERDACFGFDEAAEVGERDAWWEVEGEELAVQGVVGGADGDGDARPRCKPMISFCVLFFGDVLFCRLPDDVYLRF